MTETNGWTAEQQAVLARLATFTQTTLHMLIAELDRSGHISRYDFARKLTNAADEAERGRAPNTSTGFDLLLMRSLASDLTDPTPGDAQWRPEIIPGGKPDTTS